MNYLNRIFRIELRRSGVAVVALIVAVPLVGLMLAHALDGAFEGRWLQLAVAARLLLMAALPLTIGGGAWLGMQEHRNNLGELLATTPKPRSGRLFPRAASLAGLAAAIYLISLAVGLPSVLGNSAYLPAAALPLSIVGVLALVAGGWLGMAAGRAVPRLITIPVLVLVTAGAAGLLPTMVEESASFGTGPSKAPAALWLSPIWTFDVQDFTTVTSRISLLQAILLVGLAITGLLLAMVGRRGLLPALVPAVAGAAVAALLLPATGTAAFATDAQALALRCTDQGPQVCVTRVHAFELDQVAAATQPILTHWAGIPEAPKRAAEGQVFDSEGFPGVPANGRADTIYFTDPYQTYLTNGKFGPKAFQQGLVDQAFTAACAKADPPGEGTAVIGAWLTGATSMLDPDPKGNDDFGTRGITLWSSSDVARINRAITALEALPAAKQKAMVAKAWAKTRACRPDALKAIEALGKA